MDERRKSIFHRINTYRGGGAPDVEGKVPHRGAGGRPAVTPSSKSKATAVGKKGKAAAAPANMPNADNIKRRMEQWRRIEEEAMRVAMEQDVGSSEVSSQL